MKVKTTSKQIKLMQSPLHTWRCGYCDLQNIFYGISPIAYTCGVYGWNYDIYQLDDEIITTGYRGMIGQSIPHEILRKYDILASNILATSKDSNQSWDEFTEQRTNKLNALRQEFLNELNNLNK